MSAFAVDWGEPVAAFEAFLNDIAAQIPKAAERLDPVAWNWEGTEFVVFSPFGSRLHASLITEPEWQYMVLRIRDFNTEFFPEEVSWLSSTPSSKRSTPCEPARSP